MAAIVSNKPRSSQAVPANRYIGERQNQLRHGHGVYVYENRFFRYEGQWENGYKHGHGKLILGDGGYYEGTFIHGEIEGHGYRLFGLSGSMYTGQFHKGEMHGQGLLRSKEGEQYEGDFMHNQKEGFGMLNARDGSCYEGEFHGNKRHGQGSQIYSNGGQYKGDWVGGRRHGQGTLRCADGSVYDGQWRGGVYHGEGTISHSSGVSYSGLWLNGRPAKEAMRLRLAKAHQGGLVVVQGETFDVYIEGVDKNGAAVDIENGRLFNISAAVKKHPKSKKTSQATSNVHSRGERRRREKEEEEEEEGDIETPFGYVAISYELLQIPQANSSASSQASLPDRDEEPLFQHGRQLPHPTSLRLPPQLRKLNKDLGPLHSSSTHDLDSYAMQESGTNEDTLTPLSGTKSLLDLNKLGENSFIDTLTPPAHSIAREGGACFESLFLPPRLVSLPLKKISRRKKGTSRSTSPHTSKEKSSSKSFSDSTHSLTQRGKVSRSVTPKTSPRTPTSLSSQSIAAATSSSSLPPPPSSPLLSKHSTPKREGEREGEREREREGEDGGRGEKKREARTIEYHRSQSVTAQKLLRKREKLCKPGLYILVISEVTTPPFLGTHFPPLYVEVMVVTNKNKTPNIAHLSVSGNQRPALKSRLY